MRTAANATRPARGPRGRGDAGFLLAETLVTFTLSAFVLLGLVSAAAVLLRATDRSVAGVQDTDSLGRTLAALSRDVGAARRARWAGEEPQDFVFRGGPNSLFFAHEEPGPSGQRELRVVSLREIVVGAQTRLMRAEAHLSMLAHGFGDLRFGPAQVLATGTARLRFHYVLGRGPDGYQGPQTDSWASGPTMPSAVIVEVVDAASSRRLLADRIAIRADGDNGCVDLSEGRNDGGSGAAPTPAPAPARPGTLPGLGGSPTPAPAPVAVQTQQNKEFCGRLDKPVPANAAARPASSAMPAEFNIFDVGVQH